MATIKLCDWTKKRLASNEPTYKLVLNGKEYEISAEALQQLQSRLDGDEAPLNHRVHAQPVRLPGTQSPTSTPVEDVGINIEAPSPFGGKVEPGLLDDLPVNAAPLQVVAPIAIPASTKERLPMPSPAQADAVIAESTRFPERTLKTLTPGKHRNIAQQKLAAKEATFEDNTRPIPDRTRRGE